MLIADGFPAEKMLVCQNAIAPAEFDPDAAKPAARPAGMEDAFIAGYVGAFVPWHRVDLMIESARALAPRYPRLRWLLVGDGVERPRIEKLLAEFGLADKFWLPGAVKHALVPSYILAMDAAVMPHSNQFGSPMKLFEYMAMGRPVVMPDVPPIAEVVADGVNGMLFRAEDAAALNGALAKLIEDEAFRRRLGARARQDALERHTWRANAQRVLAAVAERREFTTKTPSHQERKSG
jgi:glycosyltransferase involved in cell wall biosynthesis